MSYADKSLTCRDCGQSFAFTAGEQEFFASRGFTNEPSRCRDCRSARRTERGGGYTSGGYTSGGYSSGGYSSGGYSSGGYSSGGGGYSSGGGGGYGGGRREREMFSATCSACGNEAQVPFQPRGDKPVYCSDCFSKQRSGSGGGGYGGGGRGYR